MSTLIDAGVDTVNATKPGQTMAQRIGQYQNLVADAVADVSSIGDLGAEVKAFSWLDGVSLADDVAQRAGFSSAKGLAIVGAVHQFLSDLGTSKTVPDAIGIVDAIRGVQTA